METLKPWVYNQIKDRVFILPMRNGNFNLEEKWETLQKGFYLTYEEWKHNEYVGTDVIVACFYLTYEEWKRIQTKGIRK